MATYNVLPQPMTGQGAFGKVPGTIDLPISRYAQVGNLYGNLPQATQQYLANAQTQMAGGIPKADLDFMQQLNAEKAQLGGMPGTNTLSGSLYGNRSARDIAKMQYDVQNQGMQNYLTGLNTLGNLQLSPELQTGVASENAALLATPDPAEAFQKQLDLYNQGLRIGASSAPWSTTRGSTTPTPQGGTGVYQMPNTTGGDRNQQPQVTVGNYVPNYSNWNTVSSAPQANYPGAISTYYNTQFDNLMGTQPVAGSGTLPAGSFQMIGNEITNPWEPTLENQQTYWGDYFPDYNTEDFWSEF